MYSLCKAEAAAEAEKPRRWADRVVVKKGERTVVVKLADVQWIESSGNYIELHAGKEKHSIRETISSFESRCWRG